MSDATEIMESGLHVAENLSATPDGSVILLAGIALVAIALVAIYALKKRGGDKKEQPWATKEDLAQIAGRMKAHDDGNVKDFAEVKTEVSQVKTAVSEVKTDIAVIKAIVERIEDREKARDDRELRK